MENASATLSHLQNQTRHENKSHTKARNARARSAKGQGAVTTSGCTTENWEVTVARPHSQPNGSLRTVSQLELFGLYGQLVIKLCEFKEQMQSFCLRIYNTLNIRNSLSCLSITG